MLTIAQFIPVILIIGVCLKEILAHVQEDMSKNVDSFTFSLLAKGEKPSPRSPLTKEEVGFCLHGGVLYSSKNERHAAT